MVLSKPFKRNRRNEMRLTLDGRKRVNLAKLLPDYEVCSFRAYTEGDTIILEPMAEIPASELLLYENRTAYESVKRGLDQAEQGKIKKIKKDFSKFIDEEV